MAGCGNGAAVQIPEVFRVYDFMNLQFFADGDGSGAAAGNNANAGGQQAGGQQQDGGQQNQPFATFPDEKSFMARVNREAKQQLEAQAKAAGFESVEAMQAALKAAREKAETEKTELQKAQEAAAKAKADKDAALAAANQRLIKAEVTLKSAELGIVDPDAAYALMDRSGVTVGDDGKVSGIDEALKALLTAKPYLKKAEGVATATSGGATNPPPGGKAPDNGGGFLDAIRKNQIRK